MKNRDHYKWYGEWKMMICNLIITETVKDEYSINSSYHDNCQHLGEVQHPLQQNMCCGFGSLSLVTALISLTSGTLRMACINRLSEKWLCWQGSLHTYDTTSQDITLHLLLSHHCNPQRHSVTHRITQFWLRWNLITDDLIIIFLPLEPHINDQGIKQKWRNN